MRHFLFIDPIEKLNIKKDSSLMMALTMQREGIDTYVFFENDFAVQNQTAPYLTCHAFTGSLKEDDCYVADFKLTDIHHLELHKSDVIHMRLDPPFDSRYLRYLWMLDHLVQSGYQVMNQPRGIMLFNEKLYAYRQEGAVPSYVGRSLQEAERFIETSQAHEFILKPLDLYSGIGVEKVSRKHVMERFPKKVEELQGPVVIQDFIKGVYEGEVRSLYFKGKELGTILKKPQKGEFLTNIAQGATFEKYELPDDIRAKCDVVALELASYGVDWIAYDILGGVITEVNITCPGLLVEVSYAYQENLAKKLIKMI
jgi:glutathione synthase